MTNYARTILSGSTNGQPIPVAATAIGSGTTIHTAVNVANQYDEVYIWATNLDTQEHSLTLAVGGTADANTLCKSLVLPPNCPPVPILCGLTFQGGVILKAASDAANVINLSGHVNTAR